MFAKLRTDARVFAPTDSPPANPSTQIASLRRHFSWPWKVRKSIPFQTVVFLGILGISGSVVREKRACKRICGLFFFFSQPVRKPIPFLTVIPVRLLLLYHSRIFISIDESDDIFPFVLCRMNKNGRKWGEKEDIGVADMRAVGR